MVDLQINIPTYNRRDNLNLCLAALQKQTDQNFQVVVGDDGSTDGTRDLILEWNLRRIQNEPRALQQEIKWVWCGDHRYYKQCKARNMAVKAAENDIRAFIFLDADVLLYPNAIALYREALTKNPNRVVLGKYWWGRAMQITVEDVFTRWDDIINERLPSIDGPLHGMEGPDIRAANFDRTTPDALHYARYDGLSVFGGNFLISRYLFNMSGGYDENISSPTEDGDFGLTLVEKGIPISYHKDIWGYHVWHPRDIETITRRSKEDVKYIDQKHGLQGTTPDKVLPAIQKGEF